MAIEKAADGTYPVTINGREYVFSKWGAERAFEVMAQLSAMTLEPFALLAGAQRKGKEEGTKIDEVLLGKAFAAFTGEMAKDPKASLKLIKALICEKSICDGHEIRDFNLHFKGRMAEMFEAAWSGLQVQYADFIEAASAFLPAAPPASAKQPAEK